MRMQRALDREAAQRGDDPLLRPRAQIVMQIHDEIVLEVEKGPVSDSTALLVRTAMEGALQDDTIPFPVTVKRGPNLGSMQTISLPKASPSIVASMAASPAPSSGPSSSSSSFTSPLSSSVSHSSSRSALSVSPLPSANDHHRQECQNEGSEHHSAPIVSSSPSNHASASSALFIPSLSRSSSALFSPSAPSSMSSPLLRSSQDFLSPLSLRPSTLPPTSPFSSAHPNQSWRSPLVDSPSSNQSLLKSEAYLFSPSHDNSAEEARTSKLDLFADDTLSTHQFHPDQKSPDEFGHGSQSFATTSLPSSQGYGRPLDLDAYDADDDAYDIDDEEFGGYFVGSGFKNTGFRTDGLDS